MKTFFGTQHDLLKS